MQLTRHWLLMLSVLVIATAQGGGVEILGPPDNEDLSKPVKAGRYVRLRVQDVNPAVVTEEGLVWYPTSGVDLIPARTWGGEPFLLFLAERPGKYMLALFVPTAGEGGCSLQREMVEIQVGESPDPEPDPEPDPDPQPTPGRRLVLVLHETGNTDVDWGNLRMRLRASEYLEQQKHTLLILDQHAKDSSGNAHPELARYLGLFDQVPLPALFVVEVADGQIGRLLHKGPCPATAEEVVKLVKQCGG